MISRCWGLIPYLVLLALAGCSTEDESGIRPAQVYLSVDGPSDTPFRFTRIQTANADHCFSYAAGGDPACREQDTFRAPFQVVLINAFLFDASPLYLRATVGVPPTDVDPLADRITVRLFIGLEQRHVVSIPPGKCFTIPDEPIPLDTEPARLPDFRCVGGECECIEDQSGEPQPVVTSPEVRFELCRATPDRSVCKDGASEAPTNIGFNVSIGDFSASDLTTCQLTPTTSDPCTTPALIYFEGAAEQVQGVFSNFGPPGTDLQADLYVNNGYVVTDVDDRTVIIDEEI